jgi:NADH-quinone oxidoreductase subunit A
MRNFNFEAFFNSTLFQVFLFIIAGFALGTVLLFLSLAVQKIFKIGKQRQIKQQTYECGVKPLSNEVVQFDIKYYVFALMFIAFDVEFIFLIPWALAMSLANVFEGKLILLSEAFAFIFVLSLGLFYAYKKKALEWD